MGGGARRYGRTAVLVAAIAALVTSVAQAATGSPAGASTAVPVSSCGQTVSSDAILIRDLRCSGDGVTIVGTDTTLNLGGHTIRSTTGTGQGVIIDGPFGSTAAVVGPGKVVGFVTGVEDYTSEVSGPFGSPRHHVRVDGVQLLDTTTGILVLEDVTSVHGVTIRATNGITGFDCLGCRPIGSVEIDGSTIVATHTSMSAYLGSGVSVTNSTLRGGFAGSAVSGGIGFTNSTLRNMTINCDEAGIVISRSRLFDSTVVFQSFCGGSLVDSSVRSSKGGTAVGLGAMGATFPVSIDGNRFLGWDTAVSVPNYSYGATITNNRFDGNGSGIRSQPCSTSSRSGGTIEGNTVLRSSGDGIALACGVWTVGDNHAVRNAGLGIDVTGTAPGTIITDAGGNVANRNAEPQCVGVVCTPP